MANGNLIADLRLDMVMIRQGVTLPRGASIHRLITPFKTACGLDRDPRTFQRPTGAFYTACPRCWPEQAEAHRQLHAANVAASEALSRA